MNRNHPFGRTAAVIFLICLLSYFNTLKTPFQFDGVVYIQQNHHIKDFSTFFNEFKITNLLNRSILVFTYTLNYYLGKENTLGYHLFNLFIHFGVSLLLYLIARKTLYFSDRRGVAPQPRRVNIPLVSALLFAAHPVHTQSVTYLMSRSASLCTFLYLGSFYCFMLAAEPRILKLAPARNNIRSAGLAGLALILMVLGLGVKLIIVSLPIMILIYYFLFAKSEGENLFRFIYKEKRLLSLIALPLVTFIVYKVFFTSQGLFRLAELGTSMFSRTDYLLSQIKWGVFYYLKTLFFPINLNADPDIGLIETLGDPRLILSALILVALILFIKSRSKIAVFGFLWFILALAPESSIIPLMDTVAEHRLYLPGVGFMLMVSILLADRRWILVHLLLIILFTANTIHRNNDWSSEKALWEDTIKKSPRKARPFINYARALYFTGEMKPAIKNYKKAIELDPGYFEPYHNLAEAYAEIGQCKEAITEYQNALILVPDLAESMVGLGKCYRELGDYNIAIAYLRQALDIRPTMYAPFRELGITYYFHLNEKQKGRFYLRQALRLNPDHPGDEILRKIIKNQ